MCDPAGVAQLVEQRTCNAKVEGSIPFTGTNKIKRLGRSARVGLFAGSRRGDVSGAPSRSNMHGIVGYIIIGGCFCAAALAAVLFVRDVKHSKRAAAKRRRLASRLKGK